MSPPFPFRPPCDRVGDPAVDLGFAPARAVDGDAELGRERALGDLAVEGRAGQAGPGKDGAEADDAVGVGHGCAGSCWGGVRGTGPVRTGQYGRARASGPA